MKLRLSCVQDDKKTNELNSICDTTKRFKQPLHKLKSRHETKIMSNIFRVYLLVSLKRSVLVFINRISRGFATDAIMWNHLVSNVISLTRLRVTNSKNVSMMFLHGTSQNTSDPRSNELIAMLCSTLTYKCLSDIKYNFRNAALSLPTCNENNNL